MPSCFLHTNLVHHGLFHSNLYAICTNIKCIHFSFSQWFFRSALINFYFPLHAAEKEADFLPSCNRCWAVCLLYWQYFLNVCRIIVHQQAVLFFFFCFGSQTHKHRDTHMTGYEGCVQPVNPWSVSGNNVLFTRPNVLISLFYFATFRSVWYVATNIEPLFFLQGNLQVWVTF